MIDTTKLTKLYYSIGEVAKLFDVTTSLIRYWEGEFPNLKPLKNRKGDRRFTKDQILELSKIYDLVKIKGFTLEGANKALQNEKQIHKRKSTALKRLVNLKKLIIAYRESI